nr:hypothetical protein Iba_chr07cCG4430 [Ipomoea batatas]
MPPSDRGGSCRRLGRDLVAHSSCWSPFEKSLSHDSRRDGDAVRCEAGPTAPQRSNRSPTTPKVQINEDEDVASFRRACFDSGWNKSSSFLDSSSGALSSPSSLSETEFSKSTRKSSTAPHMRLQFIQIVINIPGTREFNEVEICRREDIREYEEDETANLASPTSSTLCSPTGSANLPLNHRLNTPSRGRSRPRWRRHAHV